MTTKASSPTQTQKNCKSEDLEKNEEVGGLQNAIGNNNFIDPFTRSLQQSIKNGNQNEKNGKKTGNPKIQISNHTILSEQGIPIILFIKGFSHFLLTEMGQIIILHLLYTLICYTTVTVQNTNLLLFKFNFDSMQGNIGDAVQCITQYSFALVTNFSYEKTCDSIEYKICDNNKFVGKKYKESNYSNCQFQKAKLSTINDFKVVELLPFIAFVTTQVMFLGNYIFLLYKYYKEGGRIRTGNYFAFTFKLDEKVWYIKFCIVQCIFFIFVCVTPLVILIKDVQFHQPNNILVLICQLLCGVYIIRNLFYKKNIVFPCNRFEFKGIQFKNQSFFETNYYFFSKLQKSVSNFQREATSANADLILERLQRKKDLKILINLFEKMFEPNFCTNSNTQEKSPKAPNKLTASQQLEIRKQEGEASVRLGKQRKPSVNTLSPRENNQEDDNTPISNSQHLQPGSYSSRQNQQLQNQAPRANAQNNNNSNNNNNNNLSNSTNNIIKKQQNPNIGGDDDSFISVSNQSQIRMLQQNEDTYVEGNNIFIKHNQNITPNQKYNAKAKMDQKNIVKPTHIAGSAIMQSSCFGKLSIDEFDGRFICHKINNTQDNFLIQRQTSSDKNIPSVTHKNPQNNSYYGSL